MKTSEAKELFRQLTVKFFPNHNVVWANQSRMQKSKPPLITLTPGNVRSPNFAGLDVDDDGLVDGSYESHMTMTIDLYTHGTAITDDDSGETLAYEDTALDELTAFNHYMNGPTCTDWCLANNISILIEEDVQNLSGIINDTNYEYRARQVIDLSFTQTMEDTTGKEDLGAMTDADIESLWI